VFLLASIISPISTVDIYRYAFEHDLPNIFLSAAVIAGAGLLVSVGLLLSPRRPLILKIAAIGFLGFIPVVFVNHVSELYTYQFSPVFSLVIGASLAGIIESNRVPRQRCIAVLLLIALLGANSAAVVSKTSMLKNNGKRAVALAGQCNKVIAAAPANSSIFILKNASTLPRYSLFIMNEFEPLEYGMQAIVRNVGRDDLRLFYWEHSDFDAVLNAGRLPTFNDRGSVYTMTVQNDVIASNCLLKGK
jgi:hypothetical protein